MSNSSPIANMVNRILSWRTAQANHFVYVPIAKDHTDVDYDEAALVQYGGYFRLWLNEMFLTNRRQWFTTWFPAVHSSVQLKFGDRDKVNFSRVTSPPEKALAEGVRINYALTELLPFNGGSVEIDAELLAIEGRNYFKTAIHVLQDFSGLVTAPLGDVLNIAEKVSQGIDTLVGNSTTETHLALHQAFVASGGGGANDLKPGYYAVILATAAQVQPANLWVRNDRLYYGAAGKEQPFREYDYMLLRVETRKERDDWRLKNIEEPLNKAIAAFAAGETEKANAFSQVALATALQSPDLAVFDRRRVALALKQELEAIKSLGAGAVGEAERKLDQVIASRAIPVEMAEAQGVLDFAELMG